MSLHAHIDARLGYFVRRGLLEAVPSAFQLRQGARVMRPLYLSESPRERAASRRTVLGQVPVRVWIQLAYCPAMLRSTTGLGHAIGAVRPSPEAQRSLSVTARRPT